MLSIILISPSYSESGTPTGVMAHAMAQMLNANGHNLRVICAMSQAPRISRERTGGIALDRLDIRAGAPGLLFAAEALRRVNDLQPTNQTQTIICIDCPEIEWMHSAFAINPKPTPRFVHLCTERNRLASSSGSTESMQPGPIGIKLPVPLHNSIWELPKAEGKTLFIPDAHSDTQRSQIVTRYRQSGADKAGWSLALPEEDGRWSMIVNADETGSSRKPISLLVAPFSTSEILPIYALEQGVMSIISASSPLAAHWPAEACIEHERDLPDALQYMTSRAQTHIHEWVESLSNQLLPAHQPEAVYASMVSVLWMNPESIDRASSLAHWKSIESMPMILRGEPA